MVWDNLHIGHLKNNVDFKDSYSWEFHGKAMVTLRLVSVAPGKSQDLPCLKRLPSIAREKRGVEQERCKK